MAQKRYGVDQIVPMLRRADVELGKGKKVPEVCKRLGITQQTYYRWRQKYGGMAPEMAKELKALQKENTRLKKLVADQAPGQRHLEGSREGKLLSLEQRRLAVSEVRRQLGPGTVSERRACRVWVSHARHSVTSRIDQQTSGSSWPRCGASPIVALGSATLACISRCEPLVGTSITSELSESGGKRTCKCLRNSTVAGGCPIVAARIAASVGVLSTRITSGRTTSSQIELRMDDRFGCWW